MARSDRPASTRERLLHLLAEAAEFEHNLLCCYRYAAFTLKREPDESLGVADLPMVAGWRKPIMSVAIEEMAHSSAGSTSTCPTAAALRRMCHSRGKRPPTHRC